MNTAHLLIGLCIASLYFNSLAATDSVANATKPVTPKTVKAGKFTFSYTIEGKNLNATVSCPVLGWIAVGFNPKNVMADANIIIGTIVDKKSVVSDQFGDGMFSHAPDSALGGTNNILSGEVKQEGGVTTMTFSIPLDSGDKYDVKLAPGDKVKVIFSAGATNDIKKKHKYTAKATINL